MCQVLSSVIVGPMRWDSRINGFGGSEAPKSSQMLLNFSETMHPLAFTRDRSSVFSYACLSLRLRGFGRVQNHFTRSCRYEALIPCENTASLAAGGHPSWVIHR
jgi:hypothetical protein